MVCVANMEIKMKIQIEVEVSDDRYICGKCQFLDDERGPWVCGLFQKYLDENQWDCPVKCDECIAHTRH